MINLIILFFGISSFILVLIMIINQIKKKYFIIKNLVVFSDGSSLEFVNILKTNQTHIDALNELNYFEKYLSVDFKDSFTDYIFYEKNFGFDYYFTEKIYNKKHKLVRKKEKGKKVDNCMLLEKFKDVYVIDVVPNNDVIQGKDDKQIYCFDILSNLGKFSFFFLKDSDNNAKGLSCSVEEIKKNLKNKTILSLERTEEFELKRKYGKFKYEFTFDDNTKYYFEFENIMEEIEGCNKYLLQLFYDPKSIEEFI